MTGSLLVAISGVALLVGAGTAFLRLDKAAPTGGFFWLLAMGTILAASMGLGQSLKTRLMIRNAEAFRALDVVSAAELRRDIEVLRGRPVVVRDVTTCVELKAGADGVAVLASRSKLSGEDEVEGEESDYLTQVEYGLEDDGNRFRLGAEALNVQVDPDGWQVWPAGPVETVVTTTNEFSAAAGRNLQETTERRVIPCGATVSITGVVATEGPYITLEPMRGTLRLLTDRPWQEVLTTTSDQAQVRLPYAIGFSLAAALMALGQLGIAVVLARKESRG